jgi:hypothetical protein
LSSLPCPNALPTNTTLVVSAKAATSAFMSPPMLL